ncbi:hypothetical protein AAVH_43212 [Aphelenchoides avenae]|nr:hypothetical protein AAVH_43212 [Aphelenchus avenae]
MLACLTFFVFVIATSDARDASLDCLERCLSPQDSPLSKSNEFLLAKPDPRCNDYSDAYSCIRSCPRGDITRWYAQHLNRLVQRPECGPNADKNNSTQFFDQVEDFAEKFQSAVEESSCVRPVEDAEAFCKLAIDCIFESVYAPIIRKSNYLRNVNKWTAVVVKVSYAINHNNNFPDEKIPEECNKWILESIQAIEMGGF